MTSAEELYDLRAKIRECADADRGILDQLRREVRPLRSEVKRIRARTVTAVAVVAADGGFNRVRFDPYLFQVVRVVDSYGHPLLVDVISSTTDPRVLTQRHLKNGEPLTALGRMMRALGVETLWELSPMIPARPDQLHPSWVQVYRELCEWAALYQFLNGDFASDTLIVVDGLLRSKVFAGDLFLRLRRLMEEAITNAWRQRRRKVFLVGIAKRSKVLQRYRLAFALEGVLTQDFPCYVEIPRSLERKAYVWPEYAKGEDDEGEAPKFVAGKMFMVKFGARPTDPLWPVDVFLPQVKEADEILSYLLADASDGFPIPLYPRSLQKAHEHASLVGFEMEILQDWIYDAIRHSLSPEDRHAMDIVLLQEEVNEGRHE